jgi:hypothetical protein
MNQKAIVVAISLFLVIVIGMFAFAYLKKQEIKNDVPLVSEQTPTGDVKFASITRIDAKHYFINGVHTYAGEIPLPTPCDLLEANATVAESYPEQMRINFSVINTAEVCASVVTNQRFKVDIIASDKATVSATFMGRNVELNLTEALAGEKPEDFELFIKG